MAEPASPRPPRALIFAIESGRWGPARLPRQLRAAGFRVAALAPIGNALGATVHLDRDHILPATRALPRLARALARCLAGWPADIIIPADEQVVALLHDLVRRGPGHGLDAAALALILASLGRRDRLDAMLLKSATQALARRHGVAVPDGGTAASAAEAAAIAAAIGYPIYLKPSFGWSGQGLVRCDDAAALAAAWPRPARRQRRMAPLRRLFGRDWYPAATSIDIQRAVTGRPAMYAAVAWQGRLLAGFAGLPQATDGATGPATIVQIGDDAAMATAAAAMVAATGASGYIGFDFMIEEGSGRALLLECNPRPVQVSHLGGGIGVDLAGALADAILGRPPKPRMPSGKQVVTLFPQHRIARQPACAEPGAVVDVPEDDAGLLAFMRAAA